MQGNWQAVQVQRRVGSFAIALVMLGIPTLSCRTRHAPGDATPPGPAHVDATQAPEIPLPATLPTSPSPETSGVASRLIRDDSCREGLLKECGPNLNGRGSVCTFIRDPAPEDPQSLLVFLTEVAALRPELRKLLLCARLQVGAKTFVALPVFMYENSSIHLMDGVWTFHLDASKIVRPAGRYESGPPQITVAMRLESEDWARLLASHIKFVGLRSTLPEQDERTEAKLTVRGIVTEVTASYRAELPVGDTVTFKIEDATLQRVETVAGAVTFGDLDQQLDQIDRQLIVEYRKFMHGGHNESGARQ